MANLLARLANNSFWLGRYMERVENLARILDVNETYARDGQPDREWRSIVELHSDEEAFFAAYPEATPGAVIEFYIVDRRNPSSMASAIALARDDGRTLRHVITTELWSHLNVFSSRLLRLQPRDLALSDLSRLLGGIKQECQTHTGIVEGTLYRDEVWAYWNVGKLIERADQTTRLLDMKYHLLETRNRDANKAVGLSQWETVLRSAAGYQAFRRTYRSDFTAKAVVEFLLFNDAAPRSVVLNMDECCRFLSLLEAEWGLEGARPARAKAKALYDSLRATDVDSVLAEGLHGFLDEIQLGLIDLTETLRHRLFGVPVTP